MADQPQVIEREQSEQIIAPCYTFATVTDQIAATVLTKHTSLFWFGGFMAGVMLLGVFLLGVTVLFAKGTGIWGIRTPVMWGFAITNFVWWIGIGHAGIVTTAVLLLLNQLWRISTNRIAEATTVSAVACSGSS